jgi:hypothetical protein
MRARSRFLVLTWVGSCALVSSAFSACSSDDSGTPAASDGSVDASMLAPPGDDDSAASEGGGRDSTVAASDGEAASGDGEAGPMSEERGVESDGAPEAGRDGGAAEGGSEGGIPDAALDGGPTDGAIDGGPTDGAPTDSALEAGPEGGTDGGDAGLTSEGVIAAYRTDACRQCAVDSDCLDPANDSPTCESTTGVSASGTPDPGVARSALCFSTLTCLLQTSCFNNDSVLGCYCGTVASTSCSTTSANGPCKTQEEDGFESTDLNVILGTPGDTSSGSSVANAIVECLYFSCNTVCGFADAGP